MMEEDKKIPVNLESTLLKENIRIMDYIRQGDDKRQFTLEDVELETKREILEGSRQDRLERKRFAQNIFWLLVAFLSVTMAIVALSGFCVLRLSDTVMVTLLATTTADVIGIFIFVVKYLFKSGR
ncbi:MAG: hypothetical protein LBL94_04900 [Prevotellaceae bacterium]|jgi:hypothetical protein|nr:hypothetical protein [Prevotellaceae bacterium]